MKLTAQQVATFNQDGFLIARDALQETDLQPVINELTEFIDARANVLFSEGKIDNIYDEKILISLVNFFFTPKIFDSEFTLFDASEGQ